MRKPQLLLQLGRGQIIAQMSAGDKSAASSENKRANTALTASDISPLRRNIF